MPTELIVFLFIGAIILGIVNGVNDHDNNIRLNKDFYKFVAYHEAAHAVMALYNGMRCLEVKLNTDEKNQIIDIRVDSGGYAAIDVGKFAKDFELIKISTMITLNFHELPQSEETINFAKRQLQILYAGDIVLHVLFDIKYKNLLLNQNTKLVFGEDKHLIENIHDYLEKMGFPVSKDEAVQEVMDVIEKNKEVKAAIHFLANTMLKNPGVRISETQILEDLKMSNFFNLYLKENA